MGATNGMGYLVRQTLNGQRQYSWRIVFLALLGIAASMAGWQGQTSALAEEENPINSLAKTRKILLDTEKVPLDSNPWQEIQGNLAITETTISETSLTPPSLWWSRDQITAEVGSSRFIEAWVAYRGSEGQPRRVDLVVNPHIWNLLNYLERYAVLNQLGSVAKSYGYSTRIFRGQDLTGAYICDFRLYPDLNAYSADTFSLETLATMNCLIELDFRGQGGIRGNPRPDES